MASERYHRPGLFHHGHDDAIKDAIAKLEEAYPSAVRPDSLEADLGAVTVAASNAVIAVQN